MGKSTKKDHKKKPKIAEILYEDRIQKSNNGNLFDLDSFCIITSHFKPSELCQLSSVCLRWHKLVTHNPIWRSLFHHYLDPNESDPVDPSSSYWFHHFSNSMNQFPYLSYMPKDFKKIKKRDLESIIERDDSSTTSDDDEDEYEDEEKEVIGIGYVMTKVSPFAIVTENTHKIAVMLSVLSHNTKYKPKLLDVVRIGYEKDNTTIPFSRVCYALYHENERQLFPSTVGTYFDDETPAIAPNVEGKFVPFLHYLSMESGDESKMEIDWEALAKKGHTSCYHWYAPKENGWAPASYYKDKNQLVCMLAETAIVS